MKQDATAAVGVEPEPGWYRWRTRKGAPSQPVKITLTGGLWFALVNGAVTPGSGRPDSLDVPFLRFNWPLHPITEAEYDHLVSAFRAADPGHPTHRPDDPVNLRRAKPLW